MRELRAVSTRPTSMPRILALGFLIGVLVAGCGTAQLVDSASAPSLQITRTPGLFILPPLAATITNPSTVNRLLDDIRELPPFPAGTTSCPVDFGTSYKLDFRSAGKTFLTAVISVQGCQGVQLSDGAFVRLHLFADLRRSAATAGPPTVSGETSRGGGSRRAAEDRAMAAI